MGNLRLLTGVRPSGQAHLGNYFAAFEPAVSMQEKYDLFLFLADYHSINTVQDPKELRSYSVKLASLLLACGIDTKKSCLYCQSMIPEVCELSWILGCITSFGTITRAHSFKEAKDKGIDINMGIVNYPILMAADILIMDSDVVPVGKDQKQHLEIARDLAIRFNTKFGQTFKVPDPLISEDLGVIPGTDGAKMSKSKNNVIPLFGTDKEWKKAVMSIQTDSLGLEDKKDASKCNVFNLYKLFSSTQEQDIMKKKYEAGGYGYGHAKLELLGKIKEKFSSMRDKYESYLKREDDVVDILKDGARRVRTIASKKLEDVKEKLGFLL